MRKNSDRITYIAPVPEYKPKPVAKITPPKIVPPPVLPPPVKTFIPPPVVVPMVKVPKPVIQAPEIKQVPQPVPEIKVNLPKAPPAPIKTGTFQPTVELAKAAPPAPHDQVKVGGFGDPHGVPPSDNSRNSGLPLPKVGSFDMPNGDGRSGRGGAAQNGGEVRQTGFGSSGPEGRPKMQQTAQAVKTTGFGDAALAGPKKSEAAAAQNETPLEIINRPKPVYTAEARQLGLEGEVLVQVVFQADGTVRVVRIVRGLGHGLDEAAVQAATKVRFKPATRGGVAVDTNATMKISFELT